jgi:hypothetical protein
VSFLWFSVFVGLFGATLVISTIVMFGLSGGPKDGNQAGLQIIGSWKIGQFQPGKELFPEGGSKVVDPLSILANRQAMKTKRLLSIIFSS